jgi:acyl carrier protein
MDTFNEIEKILVDLLDLEDAEMTPETFLIQELGAESIDLLELAVAINSRFKITVKDDEIFLTRFRLYLTEAEQHNTNKTLYIAQKYPFLTEGRIVEIIEYISEGPQLKIKDLISYVTFHIQKV